MGKTVRSGHVFISLREITRHKAARTTEMWLLVCEKTSYCGLGAPPMSRHKPFNFVGGHRHVLLPREGANSLSYLIGHSPERGVVISFILQMCELQRFTNNSAYRNGFPIMPKTWPVRPGWLY
jgi:hypothetical protein